MATPLGEEEVGLTVVTGGGSAGDYGLYTYATTGFEYTDALAGSRHDYPARTYLTIQPGAAANWSGGRHWSSAGRSGTSAPTAR